MNFYCCFALAILVQVGYAIPPPPHYPHPHPYPHPYPVEPPCEPEPVPPPRPHPVPHPIPHPVYHPHPVEPPCEPEPVPLPRPHPHPVPHPVPHPLPHPVPHPVPHHVPHHVPHPVPQPHYVHVRPLPKVVHYEGFDKTFSFGVASDAYGHEGAWRQDGKVESIADHYSHYRNELIADGSNGDISANEYNLFEHDVELFNNLTNRHYVFTLAWSRIMCCDGSINKAGIHHYQRKLQLLRANQIEPIVVLYSGDLPQCLQDQGGFLNPDFMNWFTEYAKVVFEYLGKDVKYWVTFMDPTTQCARGYGNGTYPPGVNDNQGVNEYICGHNLLKAHASVYHLYDDCYRLTQKGKISIGLVANWYKPATDCEADIQATELRIQFEYGWFANPIYIGDYPQQMIERIAKLSKLQGYHAPRLPVFTKHEIKWIRGTHDFFGMVYIGTYEVSAIADELCMSPTWNNDAGSIITKVEGDDTWGIGESLVWIQKTYNNPAIFILGNGYPSYDATLHDTFRVEYIQKILRVILHTMHKYDVRVYAYTYFSYIDGFTGRTGYLVKFGLYHVDFDCDTRPRTPRLSALYYQHVCRTGYIDGPW